jgi:hypothetical protein
VFLFLSVNTFIVTKSALSQSHCSRYPNFIPKLNENGWILTFFFFPSLAPLFFGGLAVFQNLTNSKLVRQSSEMAGARGCFNCGGCAWCPVDSFPHSSTRLRREDGCKRPFFLQRLVTFFLVSFLCCAWCGADVGRCFSPHLPCFF